MSETTKLINAGTTENSGSEIEIKFTSTEAYAIIVAARTLYGEARGAGAEGMIAVANVIKNRVRTPGWWGRDLISVCRTPDQFSCWLPGPDYDAMMKADMLDLSFCAALAIAAQLQASLTRQSNFEKLDDLVGDAVFYHASDMNPPPLWAAKMIFVREIGGQKFYALPHW